MATASRVQYVTPAEAADILSVSRQTIYRMLNAGQLPSRRLRHLHRIPMHALEPDHQPTDR